MRVFISWSGDLSHELAAALRDWLPSTLQYVKPYFAPADVEKGAKWDSEITKELETSNICVIALTRESLESRWIHFEAGAIARSVQKSRVCSILFGIEPTDIQGPLATFQSCKFTEKEIYQLLITINNAAGETSLSSAVLDSVFKKWWPDLQERVAAIMNSSQTGRQPKIVRADRELIEEILSILRTVKSFTTLPAPKRQVVPDILYEKKQPYKVPIAVETHYHLQLRYKSRAYSPEERRQKFFQS